VFNSENIKMTVDVESEDKAVSEREWRNAQYSEVVIALDRHSDGSHSAVGTVAMWRDYRESLRLYPQQPDFPNGVRPSCPI
jgi:hypothetical protein